MTELGHEEAFKLLSGLTLGPQQLTVTERDRNDVARQS
jgi:hypothetical protein